MSRRWPLGPTTASLGAFTVDTDFDDLPVEVVREAKRVILDSVGCAIASQRSRKGRIVADFVADLGGHPQATVLGTSIRTSSPHAAFANAELINGLDADAVLLNISHVVPIVLPGALALGEQHQASGRDVIAALAIGHEIAARLTLAILPLMGTGESGSARWVLSPVSGYSFGILGAAATAGKMVRLNTDALAHALGIAAYFAAVPAHLKWIVTQPRSMTKYTPMGWTAQGGVVAALLALRGYTGDTTALDGERGFWQFWGSSRCDYAYLHEALGQKWYSVEGTSYKPYPLCNLYRPHLSMLEAIIRRERLVAEEIDSIVLRTQAVTSANFDPRNFSDVTDEIDVHMSGEYAVATLVHGIPAGPAWIDPITMNDARIRHFMKRVQIEANPTTREVAYSHSLTRVEPSIFLRCPSTVEVRARGHIYTDERDYGKGDNWAPAEWRMSDEELVAKFRANAEGTLPPEHVEKLLAGIRGLDEVENVAELLRLAQWRIAPSY